MNNQISSEERLMKLQHLFSVDLKIKNLMNKICPPSENEAINDDEIMKYVDDTYDELIYIFSELKCIANDVFGQNAIYKKISDFEIQAKNEFAHCGINLESLRNFYRKYISDMKLNFIDAVKSEFVGYGYQGYANSLSLASTVNEYLHMIHSYVLNNYEIFKSITALKEKNNTGNYPIALRGYNSEISNKLFDEFPLDLDVGWTDIVVVNENKILMMVRDRGHALTIEISLRHNIARIDYFIPKLCNIDMINDLPGVNKVNENSVGATGNVEIPVEELNNFLYDFISKVPTDYDMVIKY